MYWCWKKIPIWINEFNLYSPKFGKISILYLLCANLCPSKMNTFEVWLNVAVQGQSIKGVTWNSDILLGWKLSHPKLGLKWYFLWSTCNLNWIEFTYLIFRQWLNVYRVLCSFGLPLASNKYQICNLPENKGQVQGWWKWYIFCNFCSSLKWMNVICFHKNTNGSYEIYYPVRNSHWWIGLQCRVPMKHVMTLNTWSW